MTRRQLSQRGVIEVLIRQGAIIPCGICRLAFNLEDVPFIERAHERCEHEYADEDLDEEWDKLENQRYAHGRNDPRHKDCHKAETARHRQVRDKSRRIRRETKKSQAKDAMRGKHFPKGAKQNSPYRKKMDGTVVWRETGEPVK